MGLDVGFLKAARKKKGERQVSSCTGLGMAPLAGREMTRTSFTWTALMNMACLAYRVRKVMLLRLCLRLACGSVRWLWWLMCEEIQADATLYSRQTKTGKCLDGSRIFFSGSFRLQGYLGRYMVERKEDL